MSSKGLFFYALNYKLLMPYKPINPNKITYASNRPNSKDRGYDRTWARLRRMKLNANPLCEECERNGIVTQAKEVHHIIPIDERPELRLVWENLESLCIACHDKTKHGLKIYK